METPAQLTSKWIHDMLSPELGLTIQSVLLHPDAAVQLQNDPRKTWSRTFNVGQVVKKALGNVQADITLKNITIICVMPESELDAFLNSGSGQIEIVEACSNLIEGRVESLAALAKAAQEDPFALQKLESLHDTIIIELSDDLQTQTGICFDKFFAQKQQYASDKKKRIFKTSISTVGTGIGVASASLAIVSVAAVPVTAGVSLIPAAIFAAIGVAAAGRSLVGLGLAIKNHLVDLDKVYHELVSMIGKLEKQITVKSSGTGKEITASVLSGLSSGLTDEFMASERAAEQLEGLFKERIAGLRQEIDESIHTIHAMFDESLVLQQKLDATKPPITDANHPLLKAMTKHEKAFAVLINSIEPIMQSLAKFQNASKECSAHLGSIKNFMKSQAGSALAGTAAKLVSPVASVIVPLATADVFGSVVALQDIIMGVVAVSTDLADIEGELQTLYKEYKSDSK